MKQKESNIMSIVIRWFPPSWFQIKYKDKIIYIDPAWMRTLFTNYPKKVEFSKWPDPIDGLPEKDLEKADMILITHSHKDHCKRVTVNRLKKKDTLVIAPEQCLKELDKDTKMIGPGEKISFGNIFVKAVDAYNTPEGRSTRKVHKKGKCVGYLISIADKRIYHAGDTDFIPEMKKFGKVDVAMLPIGGTFTMNVDEAVEAALVIKPLMVIPMHFKKKGNPQAYKKKVEAKSNIKVVLLKIGEVYCL